MAHEEIRERFGKEVQALQLTMRTVCEVGPNLPAVTQIAPLVPLAERALFIEPNENACIELRKAFPDSDVVHGAIVPDDYEGYFVPFVDLGPHSEVGYVKGTHAPVHGADAKLQRTLKRHQRYIDVAAVPFRTVDDGTIDVISIDCEGSEWHVLANMVSRPKVLSIEIGSISMNKFKNTFENEIRNWLSQNHYTLWYTHDSDEVFRLTDRSPMRLE